MPRSLVRRGLIVLLGGLALLPLGWGAYAVATWLRFGQTRARPAAASTLARYMPRYDIVEVHQTRVHAPASLTYRAVQELRLQRSGIINAIFRGRELMLGSSPDTLSSIPFLEELRAIGWGVLQETPGRELVIGSITQPWESNVVFRSLPARSYAAFDSAGFVKITVSFKVDSIAPGESQFITETRALSTDSVSRARFRRYWAIFSPGILLIRSEALKLVRRDAERRVEKQGS